MCHIFRSVIQHICIGELAIYFIISAKVRSFSDLVTIARLLRSVLGECTYLQLNQFARSVHRPSHLATWPACGGGARVSRCRGPGTFCGRRRILPSPRCRQPRCMDQKSRSESLCASCWLLLTCIQFFRVGIQA